MKLKPRNSYGLAGAIALGALVRGRLLCICLLLLALSVTVIVPAHAQDLAEIRQQERDVKVAIVFKLLRFVEWPAQRLADEEPLILCVWSGEPYTETFREIEGSTVAGHSLVVQQLDARNAESCHVLFSSGEISRSVSQWRSISDGRAILTISDIDNFAAQSGMIHLMMRDQRVVFAVNVEAMESAMLRMSALVLNLAEIQQSNFALPQIQTPVENTNEQR
ncbi:MAG: YfiR family protein [Pseudomonadales bacterium]